MNRRIAYYLAAAAVALAAIAGALQGGNALAGSPMDEEHWDGQRAGINIKSQATELNVRAPAAPGVVLAGFNSRKNGTEVSY